MSKAKLRHIAISVPDKEKAAAFYQKAFGLERVSESNIAVRLSDGTVNLTLLQFVTDEDTGDERGKDFAGLHHMGIIVDDLDSVGKLVEENGARRHAGPPGHDPENAERKYRDPNGVVFDISTAGWDGAK